MSEITIYACDGCKKETRDYYAEKGWLRTDGSITLMKGRRKDGQAITGFLNEQKRFFCSVKCLAAKLEAA